MERASDIARYGRTHDVAGFHFLHPGPVPKELVAFKKAD
jgi:hypothetical protein